VEAIDKLDPHKRLTPTNRELKAQGLGNMVSGLIGGIPITQVIVRSSANVQSGGQTKMSAIIHGFLLLFSVLLVPDILNIIPLASLAAILIYIGYKLAKPELFIQMYKNGWSQIIPFVSTIAAILLTDLLIGIFVGMAVALFFIWVIFHPDSDLQTVREHSFLFRPFIAINNSPGGVQKIYPLFIRGN